MKFDLDKMYCGAIKRGDILLAHLEEGEEVVIAVQENILNERLSTVLAVPIEPHSAGKIVFKNELLLSAKELSLGQAGVCLPHKMKPYDRRRLTAKKGELNKQRLAELYSIIDVNLGRFRDR